MGRKSAATPRGIPTPEELRRRAFEPAPPAAPRYVLTELARGFLLSQTEPERARKFASQFVQEQSGGPLAHAPLHERPLAQRPTRFAPPSVGPLDP